MILSYLVHYETWLIIGLVLIAADMLLGLDFFALAFGIGALLTGLTLAFLGRIPFGDDWPSTLVYFALLSVLVLVPLRRWLRKDEPRGGSDINEY